MQTRQPFVAGLALWAAFGAAAAAQPRPPVAAWSFDDLAEPVTADAATGARDAVLGNFGVAPGVAGLALRLDGYTTRVVRKAEAAPRLAEALTVEAWVALAAYPWNRAAIVSHAREPYAGYYVGIGPRGELIFGAMVDGRWRTVESADYVVPLRRWIHIAATYDRAAGFALYADGREVARHHIDTDGHLGSGRRSRGLTGLVEGADGADLLIGMNGQPVRPFDWHRLEGTRPAWYSLDGLLDEVRVFDTSLSAADVARAAAEASPGEPELAPRVMPSGPAGPGRFGAYHTRLEYDDGWDALWQVGQHPDVLIRFDRSPARLVFWRGTQYGPAWVTEEGHWMADQSVEGYDRDFTWEHMNDKQNRYSHVRVIEQSDARVVVHWRYALVNVLNQLWNVDVKTGNGTWIDEYYYIYPDATAVRKVTWQVDRLGHPIQFQESLPFTHAGQLQGEVMHPEYVTVGNLRGETQVFAYVENAPAKTTKPIPDDLTIQMHNLRSAQKPFIAFEPGNQMGYLVDMDIFALSRGAHHSHWPVAQIPSDGRTNQAPDGPGHFCGFPISRPPVHHDGRRGWWNGLYGMTERTFPELVSVARSWAQAPELRVDGTVYVSGGFDRSERAYLLRRQADRRVGLRLEALASAEAPVRNLALVIENWGDDDATLAIDGRPVTRGIGFRYGHRHTLTGTDLIVWMELARDRPVSLTLTPTR